MPRNEVFVPANEGGASVIRRGEVIRIVDVEGHQICDFTCFNLHNPAEKLSTGETVAFNLVNDTWSSYITKGSRIRSNLHNTMFEITEDHARGVHDLLFPPCSSAVYAECLGDPTHRNCRDNLALAVEEYGLHYIDVPEPINFFQYSRPRPDGVIEWQPAPTEAGEYIELKAAMDCLVAVSACPFDLEVEGQRPNGDVCTPLKIAFV